MERILGCDSKPGFRLAIKITGNALRYDPKKREVEVTGSARLERGGTVMTSEKIIYSLDTGKVQTEGPSKTVLPDKPAR